MSKAKTVADMTTQELFDLFRPNAAEAHRRAIATGVPQYVGFRNVGDDRCQVEVASEAEAEALGADFEKIIGFSSSGEISLIVGNDITPTYLN